MKKAFTLSEALVTLAILGVLAAILIPVINNVRPDKDKIAYKKALYTMQNAISNAMDSTEYSMAANSAAYWGDRNIGENDFCLSVADTLNIVGEPNCNCDNGSFTSSYDNPNFITTDGIRYWHLECKVFDPKDPTNRTREIFVDRKLSPGEINSIAKYRNRDDLGEGLKIKVRYDGKVGTDADSYESELVENGDQLQRKNPESGG